MRHGSGIDPAKLFEDRIPLADERASSIELAAHRVEGGQRVKSFGDSNRAAPNLVADVEAELDSLYHRRRADNGR